MVIQSVVTVAGKQQGTIEVEKVRLTCQESRWRHS
jgi:hypothetical protein